MDSITRMAGFERLVCPIHRFEVITCMRGCMLEEHRSKASQGGLERGTSNFMNGIGRLGQRLIVRLHDHR